MILALLSAALLSQACNTPTGITVFSEPLCPSATAYQYRVLANTSAKCLAFARDGQWRCLAEEGAPAEGIRSSATPPSVLQVGDAYVDTSQSPPCLRISIDGSTWGSCLASDTPPDLERVSSYATAPSLPMGSAALNRGARYFDTTLGCTRFTVDGLNWGGCLTIEKCITASVSGLSIPLLGISTTSTVTLTGARVGSPCSVGVPGFLPLNASGVCRISAADTVEYRFQSNSGLLSLAIAVPNGTYSFCTQVVR